MKLSDRYEKMPVVGKDFPRLVGNAKLTLHNCKNGKTEVYEHHNDVTDALSDIFAGNYGGLVDYQNFADIYRTWLGGVLLFSNPLDVSSQGWEKDYGIPSSDSNPCVAHAGQIALSDPNDDSTRGNPAAIPQPQVGSTKLVWEWTPSQGNGEISSLGLTHSDVGSYGCGIESNAQKSLVPFVDIGCLSRSYTYGNDGVAPMAINEDIAYTVYLENATTVKIYKTPINSKKYKLQGGSLLPLTDYTESPIVATVPTCTRNAAGDFYYHFDFDNDKCIIFRVPTASGTALLVDEISLIDGSVSSRSITVTGAELWKFKNWPSSSATGSGAENLVLPTKAMVKDGYLYLYGNEPVGSYNTPYPRKLFKVNLLNSSAQIVEVDTSDFDSFSVRSGNTTADRIASLGGLIVHDNFLINSDKTFQLAADRVSNAANRVYAKTDSIVSPVFGHGASLNMVSACKLYLATKWNLPGGTVTKSITQSMTVEYTLTEV